MIKKLIGIIVAVLNQLLIRSGREAVSYTHLTLPTKLEV